ncbi:MAG: flagellar basal body P-ring protein FlgI [Alphaproteobacteria bacterium]|nr:flagellar basal body P-ring protein FlgI [Alphaproteobacteria bacterium]
MTASTGLKPFSLLLAVWVAVASLPMPARAEARIKDIATFEGIRENMLMGYGLVVGLKATGDNLKNNAFTEQSLVAFLERQGVNTRGTELKSKNVAAVTVTAMLPPFSRSGNKIDVTVSAMGDAKDLTGGTLLATPLYGADGEVYAVAQGSISIGGFQAGEGATTITKGVPTSGIIASGAIVEKEIEFALNSLPELKISLRNPDITTAKHVAEAINNNIGPGIAMVADPGTVQIAVPPAYLGNNTQLLAEVEKLTVPTDQVARIVIDEASGTIVMGENVKIDTVAVAQGNLIVKIEATQQVSQPGVLAPVGAETVTTQQTAVTVEEAGPGKKMAVLEGGATLKDLVAGLNALGVSPRDLITILQTIKAAGALQAEIQTR